MTVIEAIVEAQAVIRKLLKIPYYNTGTSGLEYPKGTPISAGGGGGAPTDAEYLVATANGSLSAERVITDSTSIVKDVTTPGQLSLSIPTEGIATSMIQLNAVGNARAAKIPAYSVKLNATNVSADAQDLALTASSFLLRPASGNLAPGTFSANGLTLVGSELRTTSYWDPATSTFKDSAGATISGVTSVPTYTALTELDPADYENYAVVCEELNRGVFFSNGTIFLPLNGQYIQEKQTLPGKVFTTPNNVTWTASDNGAGKVRLLASAPHGLTGAKANGTYLRLLTGGLGWTSNTDHQIDPTAGIFSTTEVDLTTAYTASMGVPVFAVMGTTAANSEIIHKEIVLPVLRANTSVIVEYEIIYSSDTGTAKRTRFTLDTINLVEQNTTAANEVIPYRHGFRNQNSASSQRSLVGNNGTGYNGGTGSMTTASVATGTAGKLIKIGTMINGPDITAQLNGYVVIIRD